MASDPKQSANPESPSSARTDKGIRIFTFPKTIFIFPTLVTALICSIGMWMIGDRLDDPLKAARDTSQVNAPAQPNAAAQPKPARAYLIPAAKRERFLSPQNLLGVLFLGILFFNLLIMAIDFPRFTIVAIALLVLLVSFILLWIGAYFHVELLRPAQEILGNVYAVANSGFYYMVVVLLTIIFIIIYITRWLDYWVILPNEILHHHGPLSDLERYPTMNLKFDKEIPDVLEFLFLGAGRLVLHVTEERKAIVLDNVLFINSKEEALKKIMSRLDVRITTDKEVAEH
jgi:hypothetical protein